MSDFKITIGIVARESIKTKTVFSLLTMLKDFPFEYDVVIKDGGALHSNREQIAQQALDNGSTYLLFIDSDMYFDAHALPKLMNSKKDIIGANYNHRRLPLIGTARNIKENTNDTLVKCDSLGMGFTLISTTALRSISHPWFFWKHDDNGNMTMAEDYWFCEKARIAGFDIWVDTTLQVKHEGSYLY